MGLTRWDPFHDLNQARQQIDRYMDTLWGRSPRNEVAGLAAYGPRMDVYQTENEVIATAELPGIESKDDIEVRIDDDTLTLKGEIKRAQEHKDQNYIHNERYFGAFTRVVQLPSRIRSDQARASYNNGVLEIRMPKAEPGSGRGHRVHIQ